MSLELEGLRWIREHPIEFMQTALRQKLDPEAQVMVEAAKRGYNLAMAGGHNTRKDYTCSIIDVWELLAFAPCTVVATGPKLDQVKKIIFYYMKKILREADLPPRTFLAGEEMIKFPGTGSEAWCVTTVSREERGESMARLTGTHRPRLRIHITEATSVPNAIWTQLVTLMSNPDVKIRATMNAIYSPGHWTYRLFNNNPVREPPKGSWRTFQLSSYDSPYCDKMWIREREKDWGKDSVLFRARVLGEFPDEPEFILIPERWIDEAMESEMEGYELATSMGVDVAGPGADLTVIQVIRGPRADPPFVVPARDQVKIADAVEEMITKEKLSPSNVNIDSTGIGVGLCDILQHRGFAVQRINFSNKAIRDKEFLNVRAEMFWHLRDKLRNGHIALPPDEYLKRDLSDIRWEEWVGGRIKLEPKEDIHERNGYSPDRADALALALYGFEGPANEPTKSEFQTLHLRSNQSLEAVIKNSMAWAHWPGPKYLRR